MLRHSPTSAGDLGRVPSCLQAAMSASFISSYAAGRVASSSSSNNSQTSYHGGKWQWKGGVGHGRVLSTSLGVGPRHCRILLTSTAADGCGRTTVDFILSFFCDAAFVSGFSVEFSLFDDRRRRGSSSSLSSSSSFSGFHSGSSEGGAMVVSELIRPVAVRKCDGLKQ